MGFAGQSEDFVLKSAGGTFLGDVNIERDDTNPIQFQIINKAVMVNGDVVGNQNYRGVDSAGTGKVWSALRMIQRSNTIGAERSDLQIRSRKGSGSQRDMLVASGTTEDGCGAIAHKTKSGAIVVGDVPSGCMICANDGTDIGIYLNDSGVLKKLQSTGLFT